MLKLYCGGTHKGLDGLGGLLNGAGNTVTVFHRGMEQNTGAIEYTQIARPRRFCCKR